MGTVLVVESNFLDELDADMAIIGVPYDIGHNGVQVHALALAVFARIPPFIVLD
jgi:hypothetical protein